MSYGCSWEPVVKVPSGSLGTQFKYVVAQRWFGHDGSLRDARTLDKSDLPYLKGIADSTPNDEVEEAAKALIDAILKHKEIIFKIGP